MAGIHGSDVEGCYSLALSGGYEDDLDYGVCFTYTGEGTVTVNLLWFLHAGYQFYPFEMLNEIAVMVSVLNIE